ncbi:MAG: BtrH N-terminal domain-containing protein [Mariprofundales bacterium]
MNSELSDFPHQHSAHCESGTAQGLMLQQNYEISEAMAFGIGSGIFFGFMPFVKVDSLPLTTYRIMPGGIIKRCAKRLNVKLKQHTYRNDNKGMDDLDRLLASGKSVGAQVGVYWLPYFPPRMRFHFNAHNILIFGKSGDDYLISDPVLDHPVRCSAHDLKKARFAKGPLAPKGKVYYLEGIPDGAMLREAAINGIHETCNKMLKIPIPLFGVKGIHYLANKLETWVGRYGRKEANIHLGQVIRMQEEIGTGGAGFRFIYAAFLQQAATLVGKDELRYLSERLTSVGDDWRYFALGGARIVKDRDGVKETYSDLAEILHNCADQEKIIFTELKKIMADVK